ncbi:MAG TPA: hypothetical protein VFI23_11230 [Rhizomicrobium sp.]|nr:hypothetical protein [Rhizomicrobium sp.]
MADETKIESIVSEQTTRRSAIKTAAQVAVTAPAVGLLLSAGTKSAMAQNRYNFSGIPQTGDDTFFADDGGKDDGTLGDDTIPHGPAFPK